MTSRQEAVDHAVLYARAAAHHADKHSPDLCREAREMAVMWAQIAPLLPTDLAVPDPDEERFCGDCGPQGDRHEPCAEPLGHDMHRDQDGCSWPVVDRSSDAADRNGSGQCVTCGDSMRMHRYDDTMDVVCGTCGVNCTKEELARAEAISTPPAQEQRKLCLWRYRSGGVFACVLDRDHGAGVMHIDGTGTMTWISPALYAFKEQPETNTGRAQ